MVIKMSYRNPSGIDIRECLNSERVKNAIEELVIAVVATAEEDNRKHPGSTAINLANVNVLMIQAIRMITDSIIYAQTGAIKEIRAKEGGN